ncbi:L-type lectin-domain containing receptor kinase IV.1, partial [Dichanthelium oligosanthes]
LEQVIVHRDVKASNVLLDAEMNGRLGDFGLARLHDHSADAHTTHVAGTRGYFTLELLRLGKATKATDVFAFRAFILEVTCGRRLMGVNARGKLLVLVDWVRQVRENWTDMSQVASKLNSNISGNGFDPVPLLMVDNGGSMPMASCCTTFVFTATPYLSGGGSGRDDYIMAFVISSTMDFSSVLPWPSSSYSPNSFIAVVLGADLNNTAFSLDSAGYRYGSNLRYVVTPNYESLRLSSGKPVQLWVDYDGRSRELNLTMAPMHEPSSRLLSGTANLSYPLLLWDSVAVAFHMGFSASTGDNKGVIAHQVLGWSFSLGAPAQPLDYSLLPLKGLEAKNKRMKNLVKWLPATIFTLTMLLAGVTAASLVLRRRRWERAEAQEEEEGWEFELGPHRFSHKELRIATNGFSSRQLLRQGGFGRVYGGELATSGTRIAVKRISSDSKQGIAQFTVEIVILGRLRHRNLLRLIGYCRHKDELLLVYEHMTNGVASGLLYLHEDLEQVIVHRDVKASNVLLDAEMNGRLGDFGLARLHDHGADAHTTHVAGTRGYLAPELLRLGKATDVFSFGAFILVVTCGRRQMGVNARGELLVLVDWVRQVWASGRIVYAMDSRLQDYVADEAELVLKLGLLRSHPLPTARPGMRLVMQYLDGDLPPPEFSLDYLAITDAFQVLDVPPLVAASITSLSRGR